MIKRISMQAKNASRRRDERMFITPGPPGSPVRGSKATGFRALSRAEVIMEALKDGTKLTDGCVFLVGLDDESAEKMNAVKSMMVIMSPYIERIFNSAFDPPKGPVRIDNIAPHVFKLVTEYVHVGEIITSVDFEEIADLSVAADFLMIEPLKRRCMTLLYQKASEKKIWTVLNKVYKLGTAFVDATLQQILCEKTTLCLSQPDFLLAEVDCVVYVMKQRYIQARSEMQLIEFCLNWAKNQPNERLAMMKLLPHLRVLVLDPKDLYKLPSFLLGEEFGKILKFRVTHEHPETPFSSAICSLTQQRNFNCQLPVAAIPYTAGLNLPFLSLY